MPYLAEALYSMLPIRTKATPTFGVDAAWRMYWNPDFCLSLSVEQCAGLWLHELGHVLRDHHGRSAALDLADELRPIYNIAGDAVINTGLALAGITLPAGGWTLDRIAGAEPTMTTEEVFRLLLNNPLCGHGHALLKCGSGSGGGRREWEVAGDPGVGGSRGRLLRRRAEHLGRAAGALPLGADRPVGVIGEPQIDWRTQLKRFIRRTEQTAGAHDYTYSRPSRRVIEGVVLPGMMRPVPPRISVVVDTSRSMAGGQLAACVAEIEGLLTALRPAQAPRVTVISCDAKASAPVNVGTTAGLTLTGGGGTDMGNGIIAALAARPVPNIVVILTDGHTPWPTERPPGRTRFLAVLVPDSGARREVPPWLPAIGVPGAATRR
jgi:predicted metal-dependent peptidase